MVVGGLLFSCLHGGGGGVGGGGRRTDCFFPRHGEVILNVLRCQLDILGTSCDQWPKHGSIYLYAHGNQKAR